MAATREQIATFLESPDWGPDEKWVIRWQFGLLSGGFEQALAECIKLADEPNLVRLGCGFPIEVMGFTSWVYGTLGTRLRKAGLDI